jgi:hypothetical protein
MNKLKTIEAIIRGYFFFRVNGEYFLLYHRAREKRVSITGNVSFEGYHVFKGWTGFFYRIGLSVS